MAARRPAHGVGRGMRRTRKPLKCPFHRDNPSRQAEGNCLFEGSPIQLKEHLLTCSFQAEEVHQLSDLQATYFQRHPVFASAAATVAKETLQRVQAGSLDEHRERMPGEVNQLAVVLGLRTRPLREQLSLLAGAPLDDADEAWLDFWELCLPGSKVPEIPCRHRAGPQQVQGMRVMGLRDDGCSENGARDDEHSMSVWIKALAEALGQSGAPDSREKILSSLDLMGAEDDEQGKVLAAFRGWDVDGNDSISQLEFATLLRALDTKISLESMDAMFVAADADRSGSIDYKEFLAWLFRKAQSESAEEAPAEPTDTMFTGTLTSAFPAANRRRLA